MTLTKSTRALLLTVGLTMAIFGLGITSLICLSGTWGIGHMWPLLLVSVSLAIVGIWLFRMGRRAKMDPGTL